MTWTDTRETCQQQEEADVFQKLLKHHKHHREHMDKKEYPPTFLKILRREAPADFGVEMLLTPCSETTEKHDPYCRLH